MYRYSIDLIINYLVFTSILRVARKLTLAIHLSPCRSSSIMPSLKRNQFSDDIRSDLLSNGCGWLFDCLSSCGIHVVALSIILWTNNDVGIYLMLVARFCFGHVFDDA